MLSNNCAYCNHDKRAYFAQLTSSGKKVVAQRCVKCLRSWKGQPFVSSLGFDWNSLPRLDDGKEQSTAKKDAQEQVFDTFFPNVRCTPVPEKRLVKGQIGYKPPELPR